MGWLFCPHREGVCVVFLINNYCTSRLVYCRSRTPFLPLSRTKNAFRATYFEENKCCRKAGAVRRNEDIFSWKPRRMLVLLYGIPRNATCLLGLQRRRCSGTAPACYDLQRGRRSDSPALLRRSLCGAIPEMIFRRRT